MFYHTHTSPILKAITAYLLLLACQGIGDFVTAQELLPLMSPPEIIPGGGLAFGFDKIANTFVFTGNADVSRPVAGLFTAVDGGYVRFTNLYRGSMFRTQATAVRDDESAQIDVQIPVGSSPDNFQLYEVTRGAWVLSQDSRSVGLSSLERGSGAVGIKLTSTGINQAADGSWSAESFAGLESTSQLGVQATGPLAGAVASMNRFELDQWFFSGRGLADWHNIDADRTNYDIDINAQIDRATSDSSHLNVSVGTTSLGRQYFTTLTGSTSPLSIEQRYEQRLLLTYDLLYWMSDKFFLGSNGQMQANAIRRSYGSGVPEILITAVDRKLGEYLLDIDAHCGVQLSSGRLSAGGELYLRTEQNTASPVHTINDDDLNSIRSQESQRDNNTSKTRLYAQALWNLSATDTLLAEWNWWILHYDTPSDLNDDDRDELTAIATLRYSKRISDLLTVGLTLSGQYVHFVFLKASRSSQNYQNNVLRLSPFVLINTSRFSMQPSFEVLANYYAYDFEGEGATVQSYGFRQLSYRDSITVRLSRTLRWETPVLALYSERSTLLWSDFAEVPQAGNLEYLVKFLIFSQTNSSWDVGAGIRLYAREQRSLVVLPGVPSLSSGVQLWAPEVDIHFTPIGGSTLSILGWYEFQTITPSDKSESPSKRELPNLLMQARVEL